MVYKSVIPTLFLFWLLSFCSCAQSTQPKKSNEINLTKLIYHSSRCYGPCPTIDMEIDSNRHIYVTRQRFHFKEPIDSGSGYFAGILPQEKFDSVIHLLKACDYNNLTFPDVNCCDGVITTLIIYSNGQRKYLRSMTPPQKAGKLISYLHEIGLNEPLAKTDKEIKLEE